MVAICAVIAILAFGGYAWKYMFDIDDSGDSAKISEITEGIKEKISGNECKDLSFEMESKDISESEDTYTIEAEYFVLSDQTINEDIEKFVNEKIDEFKKKQEELTSQNIGKNILEIFPHLVFLNGKVISIRFETYSYLNGAHGVEGIVTKNYNLVDSQGLALGDIFSSGDYPGKISEMVINNFLATGNFDDESLESVLREGAAAEEENFQKFVIDRDAITFYFDPYEIAPYAMGVQKTEIYFEDIKDILNEDKLIELGIFEKEEEEGKNDKQTIANPASVNCKDKGGNLIVKTGPLGQYGVCEFEDGRQCEEWAFFREDCPDGGIDVSTYTTSASRYCAIIGGKYNSTDRAGEEDEQGTCKFSNGKECDVWQLWEGACSKNDGS